MESEIMRRRGRPPKLLFEEKKKIVDSFFAFEAGYDRQKLKEYNIYTQLANYATKLNWLGNGRPITPKNLADSNTRAYIEKLAGEDDSRPHQTHTGYVPVYVPLDFQSLETKSIDEIILLVKTRELYYESVCINSGKTASLCAALQKESNMVKNNLYETEEKLRATAQSLSTLEKEHKKLKLCFEQLKRTAHKIGKQSVEDYFESIPNRGYGNNNISLIGQQHVGVLCTNDEETNDSSFTEWCYDK